jgi:glutamate 5-kinase
MTSITVIKLGTRVAQTHLSMIAQQLRDLHDGNPGGFVIVSSGAVSSGMRVLRWTDRPADLASKQACAAIGQPLLMQTWSTSLSPVQAAQVLVTHEDILHETTNIRNTILRLLEIGVIPIINENDTVSTTELAIGDNDQLGARVARILGAGMYIIYSSIPGLLDKRNQVIPEVGEITADTRALVKDAFDAHSVGGMRTKLLAAELCLQDGIPVFIGSPNEPILSVLGRTAMGTLFHNKKK